VSEEPERLSGEVADGFISRAVWFIHHDGIFRTSFKRHSSSSYELFVKAPWCSSGGTPPGGYLAYKLYVINKIGNLYPPKSCK
jgi:hypothetical protein